MRKITTFFETILLLMVVKSASAQAPVADFDIPVGSFCEGSSVNFADSSSNLPNTWTWYFQGASPDTSVVQHPSGVMYSSAGSYAVTLIVSNGGGADTLTKFITINPNPSLSIIATNSICNGSNDGTATAVAGGGVSPYTYLWGPGGETVGAIANLSPGNYTLAITDANGCSASDLATITEPTPLNVSSNTSDPACNGSSDGQITALVTGGVSPYTYAWDSPLIETTQTVTGLAAGSYGVTITDNNGCSIYDNKTLIDPNLISINMSTINPTCNGGFDGQITAIVSGGVSPYTYLWDSPLFTTNQTETSLFAGLYGVTVTDNAGCTMHNSVSLVEPNAISITFNTTNPTCNGDTDGDIFALVSGGSSPYTYAWDSPLVNTTNNATGLSGGNYGLTVTDNVGCTMYNSTTLVEPTILDIVVINDTICEGVSGLLIANTSGGTSPYNHVWDDPLTTNVTVMNDSPLTTTTYQVIVVDANGCTTSTTADIIVNPLPTANSDFVSQCEDISGSGQSEFDLTLLESAITGGGQGTVDWFTNASLSTPILNPATYNSVSDTVYANVTDLNACKKTAAVELVVKDSTTNFITGTVSYQGTPITNGDVTLIRKNGILPTDMYHVNLNSINSAGEYSFGFISKGDYIIKAIGDTMIYSNSATYADSAAHWQDAIVYTVLGTCNDTVTVNNISLIDVPASFGTGTISGQLIEHDGSAKQPGDPIPGIDITVEQSPGGVIVGGTTTDINGEFNFYDLEVGDYLVYADMHGYTMVISDTLTYTGLNENYDIVLCANTDSFDIDMCDKVLTSIASIAIENNSLELYPNPTKDNVTVKLEGVVFDIQILDIQGRVVLNKSNVKESITLNLAQLNNGLYQVKVYDEKQFVTQKLIINR